MPQPVSYNPGTPVSGSIQENSISYVVDGQNRNYRGGFGGLSWMSEVPAANNVIFIGNSVSLGRGPANIPLFYPSYNNSAANIIYAANTLPGSPRNFTTTGSAYNWAVTNNFFINNSDNPIPRIDADGLGLYIDANQPTSYPQTGTTWYDLSGITNNSGLYNGPTWNSNGYIQFDGTDDFVGVGNTGVTKLNQNYQTLRFLIYITSVGPNGYSELYAVTNANRTGIKWQDNGIGMDANGDFYNVFVNVSNAYSQWMDISCVIDRVGNIFKVYKNGTYIGQDTFTPYTANSTDITIGANRLTGNGGDYIKGNISEVSVYSKELSLSEIQQNYFQGNIVTGSLVFMVDANNLVSYPKSGTTAYALTGSNNGTLVNGVAYGYPNGGYWNFDGTDDSINIGTLSYSNNITLEAWVNTTNPTGWDDIIAGGCGDLLFGINSSGNGTLSWGGQCNVPFSPVTSTISITDGNWHHVVGTYNGSVAALYIDGNLEVSGNRSGNFTPGNIAIGSVGGGGEYFNGKIANVRIYNKALLSTEVQQNYQATKDKFLGQNIVTNGLVLNLDSANKDSYPGTGTTWNNTISNSYNGTLNNGPSFLSNINGGVIAFDGVDDEVTGPKPTFSAVTLEYYCKLTGNSTGGYPHIVMSGNTFIGFIGNTSSARFRIAINPGAGYSEITSDLLNPSTNFNLYSMTYDGTTVRMYVNGVLQSNTMNIPPTFSLMDGNAYYLNATTTPSYDKAPNQIPIFRLYNRALSTTEVLQNYNAQKIRFGL
jgi:hypothetical protein